MERSPKKILIFASGNGSNAENIIKHFSPNDKNAKVVGVICNREGAGVIERCRKLGVDVTVMTRDEICDPAKMNPLFDTTGCDVIVLAGFLLMVPDYMIERFGDRIFNIHPSLLPRHGGRGMFGHHVHEAVIASGDKATGITVHRVSRVCDGGEIIFQAAIPVDRSDTPSTIEAKIHILEMEHFPRVIEHHI